MKRSTNAVKFAEQRKSENPLIMRLRALWTGATNPHLFGRCERHDALERIVWRFWEEQCPYV